jgi:outer membrane protein
MDAYRAAASGNPGLKAAAAARLAKREAGPQSKARLLPRVGFNAEVARERFDAAGLPERSSTAQDYALTLTQPIYRRELFIQRRQAATQVEQADAEYAAAELDLMNEVAGGYFDVLGAMDNLEFARAEKAAIERQLQQARARFEVGLIAITEVHEAQARFDLASSREIVAENDLATAREALRQLTGVDYAALAPLGDDLPLLSPDPQDPERWVEAAQEGNLRLRAARQGVEIARQEIKRQRAGHYPSLDLVGSHYYTDSSAPISGSVEGTGTSIGLQLNIPLYQGGLVNSSTREASHRYEEASQRLEEQRRATLRDTRDAYRRVVAGVSQVRALEQAVVSGQSALDATQAGFEVGTRTIVDVLDAQSELYRALREHARARYDYILNTLRLRQAAGTLSADDLNQVNSWLTRVSN